MSDAQIDASVTQPKQMAENPDLIRMATESPELFATEHKVLSSNGKGYEQSELGRRVNFESTHVSFKGSGVGRKDTPCQQLRRTPC